MTLLVAAAVTLTIPVAFRYLIDIGFIAGASGGRHFYRHFYIGNPSGLKYFFEVLSGVLAG